LPNFKRVKGVWEKSEEKVYADLILGSHKDITWTNIFPNPITHFCRDKTQIESLFPKYCFTSEYCENYRDIEKKFSKISRNTKVLKPVFGSK